MNEEVSWQACSLSFPFHFSLWAYCIYDYVFMWYAHECVHVCGPEYVLREEDNFASRPHIAPW